MQIKEINDKNIWENFYKNIPLEEKTFLNSWNWGEFYKSMDSKIFRYGIYDHDFLIATALVIKKESENNLKKFWGRHLFLPHSPSILGKFKPKTSQILEILLEKIKQVAREEKANFIRINPIFSRTSEYEEIFSKLNFLDSPVFVHPEVTWILDISKSQDQLMSEMRKTTRYMIKQGEKYGVKISQGNDIEDVKKYNKIYIETVKRQKFEPFSEKYLINELKAFNKDGEMEVFFANESESGAMIIFWQDQAFYHQGASDIKNPKAGASYLLQWNIIKEAQKRGCKIYNFWGIEEDIKSKDDINSDIAKKHPWWGLSLFKMGFGGKRIDYLKTKDYPITFLYWPFRIYEKIRRFKKRI